MKPEILKDFIDNYFKIEKKCENILKAYNKICSLYKYDDNVPNYNISYDFEGFEFYPDNKKLIKIKYSSYYRGEDSYDHLDLTIEEFCLDLTRLIENLKNERIKSIEDYKIKMIENEEHRKVIYEKNKEEQRIRKLMESPDYWDKKVPSVVQEVEDWFRKTYNK